MARDWPSAGRLFHVRRPVIHIDPEALEALHAEALAAKDGLETGGILLGCDDAAAGETHVTLVGGPGPNAQRRADFFCRDLAYAIELGDQAYARDGSVWVGEWHTHPGAQVRPSRRDLRTYRGFLEDPVLEFEHFACVIVASDDGWESVACAAWIISLPPGDRSERVRVRSAIFEVGGADGSSGR
jgi:integrative and conjugative element protein (TIGR02256 family)